MQMMFEKERRKNHLRKQVEIDVCVCVLVRLHEYTLENAGSVAYRFIAPCVCIPKEGIKREPTL
jgi:hypothetical protein